ncbi:MAG: hypothetical protein IPM88_20575 [Nitrospira sp.]|nr:hypothetical protein [Nitrospira sp.]
MTQLQQSDARVRVVYKDFPILGETSELAAKAALASNLQGKHRAFHEALLAAKDDLTKEQLFHIAQDTGLDVTRLDRDLEQARVAIDHRAQPYPGQNPRHPAAPPAFIIGNDLVPGAVDLKRCKNWSHTSASRLPARPACLSDM